MNPAQATREVFWNIGHAWVMYALLVPTVATAGYGLLRRWRLWRQGQPESAASISRSGAWRSWCSMACSSGVPGATVIPVHCTR